MSWLRRLWRRPPVSSAPADDTPPPQERPRLSDIVNCRPGWPHGMHGEVIYGLGGMGDASLCLRCGLDTYARIWPRESIREARGEPDFEIIREARARGLENN